MVPETRGNAKAIRVHAADYDRSDDSDHSENSLISDTKTEAIDAAKFFKLIRVGKS